MRRERDLRSANYIRARSAYPPTLIFPQPTRDNLMVLYILRFYCIHKYIYVKKNKGKLIKLRNLFIYLFIKILSVAEHVYVVFEVDLRAKSEFAVEN